MFGGGGSAVSEVRPSKEASNAYSGVQLFQRSAEWNEAAPPDHGGVFNGMSRQKRDIHIIGGGPVGLYTALLILDRHLSAWVGINDDSQWGLRSAFDSVDRKYAYIAPNITIWEKRPDRWTSQTRKNVMFLSPSNPIFSLTTGAELRHNLRVNGLCVVKPPNIGRGGVCFPLHKNGDDVEIPAHGTGGFAITIWRLQNALGEMLRKHQFRKNVTFKYGEEPEIIPGKPFPSNMVVIDATGGRSSFMRDLVKYGQGECTQRYASKPRVGETWVDHNQRDLRTQAQRPPDAYGMTINIPSDIIPGKSVVIADSQPQNRYRLLPMYQLDQNARGGWDIKYTTAPKEYDHPSDPNVAGYSFYLGVNLTGREYSSALNGEPGGGGAAAGLKGIPRREQHFNMLPHSLRQRVARILSENELISGSILPDQWRAFNARVPDRRLNRIPVSIFPIQLGFEGSTAWRDDSKNNTYYLVGDSVFNVHFFSGTGINSGMKCAYEIAKLLIVDQELPLAGMSAIEKEREVIANYNAFATELARKSMQASCNVDYRSAVRGETLPVESVCNRVRDTYPIGPQYFVEAEGRWVDVTITAHHEDPTGMYYNIMIPQRGGPPIVHKTRPDDQKFRMREPLGQSIRGDILCRGSNDQRGQSSCIGFDCK